tara:strand:+ start:78 stop:512 length:435 start_codon:yes stop_codon:yes gene_type:complete
MKKLSLSLLIAFMTAIYAEDIDPYQMYQGSIDYKMSADLADVYDRCTDLYTGIYGFTSNNPESSWSSLNPEEFLKAASQYTVLSSKIKQQINWVGRNLDDQVKRSMYYKDMIDAGENDKQAKSFIREEIRACRDAIAKDHIEYE